MNVPEGLITQFISQPFTEVCDSIEKFLREKNVTIFARIDHSAAAQKVGLTLPPEIVYIFGNPAVGTSLMVENPVIGIELPLKILVWQRKNGTQIAYQAVEKLAKAFHIETEKKTVTMLETFMQKLIEIISGSK